MTEPVRHFRVLSRHPLARDVAYPMCLNPNQEQLHGVTVTNRFEVNCSQCKRMMG